MTVLDSTAVTVAIPVMQRTLGLTEQSVTWVLNAYMLTYGGFLILSGRLGDLYGRRRIFLIGVCVFTLSSLACGLARGDVVLLAARL